MAWDPSQVWLASSRPALNLSAAQRWRIPGPEVKQSEGIPGGTRNIRGPAERPHCPQRHFGNGAPLPGSTRPRFSPIRRAWAERSPAGQPCRARARGQQAARPRYSLLEPGLGLGETAVVESEDIRADAPGHSARQLTPVGSSTGQRGSPTSPAGSLQNQARPRKTGAPGRPRSAGLHQPRHGFPCAVDLGGRPLGKRSLRWQ